MTLLQPERPAKHAIWCSEHPEDPDEPDYEGACFSDTLEIDFGAREHAGDAVDVATLFLARTGEGTLLTLIGGITSLSLQTDQIRPLAMALLAYDAIASGNAADAEFYRDEALRGTADV